MTKHDRAKATLVAQEWEPTDRDLFIQRPYETEAPDATLCTKLPEWLQNWRVNHDTIGFDKTVEDMPAVEGKALVVDNPMSGALDRHIGALREFRGTVLSCDRAAWKLCREDIVPDIACNVDSSFLCVPFFDNPWVRAHAHKIHGVFASTTNPLTVRAFPGRRHWFQPWLGIPLTDSLAAAGRLPVMSTGGCVHNTLWVLAVNLGAKEVGLVGVENSYDSYSQTEYPGVRHAVMENAYGRFYADPVYLHYNEILLKYAKFARDRHGVRTVNCNRGGILYGGGVEDMGLEEFAR